jgi:hypothetical protein
MNKRKPFTPNTQSQGSSLESPAQVEAAVNDYSAEIEELKSEMASLKKDLEEFKSQLKVKEEKTTSSNSDEKVENIVKFLLSISNKSKLEKFNLF